jgi:hypothetical protein
MLSIQLAAHSASQSDCGTFESMQGRFQVETQSTGIRLQVVEHVKTHLDRCYRGPIVPGDFQSNCGAHGIKKAGRFADIKSD